MSRFILSMAAALCVALSGCSKTPQPDANSDLLKATQGRYLLINYWAEWCKPCLQEIPELNRFQREFSAKAAVYAVNFDGLQGAELQQQIEKLRIEIPVLAADPARQLGFERPAALPSTFVFGPDGKFKTVLQGEQTVATLAAAIGETLP